MIINSHNIEFGYELLSALPRAYELHLQGKLTETISGIGSEPLYYFSPKHTINENPRSWYNTEKARKSGLPYTFIHSEPRPQLVFPPYKKIYANKKYKWNKPTLVIANRYNKEWNVEPINFFDLETLDWLFTNLKKDYEIVYIAVDLPTELQDNEAPIVLNDRELAAYHAVKVFQDIKGDCWNTSLLQVFANCEHYITMNGGYAILASFFTGTNIAYTRARGIVSSYEYKTKEFDHYYPNHNNQRTIGVYDEKEFKEKVQAVYIDKLPTANIIIRTSNRPNGFKIAYESIRIQDYKNINVVVTYDDEKDFEYIKHYPVRTIKVQPQPIRPKPEGIDYGDYFAANEYLEMVQKRVHGFVLFLDDDDEYTLPTSISEVMAKTNKDSLAVWKVDCARGVVVPNGTFGKMIKVRDVSGIGICYHTDYAHLSDWGQWRLGDFRTARNIANSLEVTWIDAILSKRQQGCGMGKRRDINQNLNGMKTYRFLENRNYFKRGDVKPLPYVVADLYLKEGIVEEVLPPKPIEPVYIPEPVEVAKELVPVMEDKELKPLKTTKNVRGNNQQRATRGRKPRGN